MNVYDFDKTIYPKDSTLELYLVTLLRHPSFLLDLPGGIRAWVRHRRGKITTDALRAAFLRSFGRLRDPDAAAERFWSKRKHKIFSYYLAQRREDDVVISASPEFVLRPIARELGFGRLIASRFDPKSGTYDGPRCYGEAKPPRFLAEVPDGHIDAFFSDSLSDTPMARLADRAYIVTKRGELVPWPEDKT